MKKRLTGLILKRCFPSKGLNSFLKCFSGQVTYEIFKKPHFTYEEPI
jgi:hypothetical protein